jgi:hypothetical protein
MLYNLNQMKILDREIFSEALLLFNLKSDIILIYYL